MILQVKQKTKFWKIGPCRHAPFKSTFGQVELSTLYLCLEWVTTCRLCHLSKIFTHRGFFWSCKARFQLWTCVSISKVLTHSGFFLFWYLWSMWSIHKGWRSSWSVAITTSRWRVIVSVSPTFHGWASMVHSRWWMVAPPIIVVLTIPSVRVLEVTLLVGEFDIVLVSLEFIYYS